MSDVAVAEIKDAVAVADIQTEDAQQHDVKFKDKPFNYDVRHQKEVAPLKLNYNDRVKDKDPLRSKKIR